MPPFVSALGPGDVATRTLKYENMFYKGTFLEGSIDDRFSGDSLSAATTLVGSDNHPTVAIQNPIAERLGTETSEDDRVNGAYPGDREKGGDGMPCHGKIDGHGFTLLDTKGFEDICNGADLVKKLRKGYVFDLTGLVSFPNDGGLLNYEEISYVVVKTLPC